MLKKSNPYSKHSGFTLIELLVVIAIIGILSGVIMASLNTARTKGLDGRIQTDMYNIQLGIMLFHDAKGVMPSNQVSETGYCNDQSGSPFLQDVVQAGYLPKTIQSPPATGIKYCYHDYGPDTVAGVLIRTTLKAAQPTTTGYPGTCRPNSGTGGWCDQTSSRDYCICTPY